MKRLAAALLVVLFHASAYCQEIPGNPNADGEIRQASERYFNAIDRRDVKSLDDLLADDCLVYYPRGVIDTKAALLKATSKPVPAGAPAQPAYALSKVKVRRIGDTAILTAVLTATRIDAPGVINNTWRTLVWARQNNRWRLMHDQWSLVGDAGSAEYWSDYFHGNDQNFNRKPNNLLTQAVTGRRPGKALDVGVGEGRNAIYLAKQGWDVTGIDRAEGALAVARQQANQQGVKITPVLQSAEEFNWGREQWDLVALLYVGAVRGNVAKIRDSLKPGGLVVIEAFVAPPGSPGGGAEYKPGELRKLFGEGFEIVRFEETGGIADYGQKPMQLVRLVASKTMTKASSPDQTVRPTKVSPDGCEIQVRRSRRSR